MIENLKSFIDNNSYCKSFYQHIIVLNQVDSTNSYAKNLNEKKNGICVFSFMQNKGRGRNNREWHSVSGKNIYLSIIVEFDNQNFLSFIPLVSSLAVRNTVNSFNIKSNIKWPNDILVNKKKISGILCEAEYVMDKKNFCIVGIGLNINNTIEDFQLETKKYNITPTSMFLELSEITSIEEVLKKLLLEFALEMESLKKNGYQSIIKKYKNFWNERGKEIEVSLGNRIVRGIAEDIKDNGHLVIKSENKFIEISSGEIISF